MLTINGLATRVSLATALLMALAAAPAAAAECAPEPTTQPFTHLGDHNYYFLAQGGDFEGGLRWTASGAASVVDGANPADPNGAQTASLDVDSSFRSPLVCVDAGRPHLRFGALSRSGTGTLKVDAFLENGSKVALARLSADGYPGWVTTPMIPLADALQIPADGVLQVRLRIAATGGGWLVDGVYIDPYLRG